MKYYYRLILIIALLSARITYAQYVSAPSMHMPNYSINGYGSAIFAKRLKNAKLTYVVDRKEGGRYTGTGKMIVSNDTAFLELKSYSGSKTNIYPSETVAISCYYSEDGKIDGFPFEGTWLFPSDYGEKINLYTALYKKKSEPSAFKLVNSDELITINKESVMKLVNGDEAARKLIDDNKLYEALQKYDGNLKNKKK
ncbi:MAG: hypothetical protein DI598_17065 [Pseudopedobacter saltans]|uniref:DUF4468 domain-containing protein n=1 Tax=Pseudopedobacter saltans TaxID=151895 RepID=A0A2W5GJE4_9SPHI|nr:MAG: hypothetical protein DI598_17065 [Pseudopedobacter saltans]